MPDDQPIDPAKLMQAFLAGWNQVRPTSAPPPEATTETSAMRLMAQALALANMPSRDDVGGVADRLDRIEALLETIVRRLDGIEASPAKKRKKKN